MEPLGNVTDEWAKNWKAKIAVRITSIVLWSLTFFSMFFASLLISQVREDTEAEQKSLLDQLSYHVIETIQNDDADLKEGFARAASSILEYEDFSQVEIFFSGQHFVFGQARESDITVDRTLFDAFELSIKIHITPIKISVRNRQIKIFMIFSISLVSLGAFLGLIIDKYVHQPFQLLESATQSYISGDKNTRVKILSKDEFGVLANFMNQMFERINDNEENLKTEAQERHIAAAKVREQRDALQTLTDELTKARDQAFAANNAKSAFLAKMSHELRTPLNAVIGYTELLIDEAQDAHQTTQIKDLEKILSAGKHLLKLINDVLDISKIEAGKMDLSLEKFKVMPLIEETVYMVTPLFKQNNNDFSYNVNDQHISMCSDTTRVKQILYNLLSNASKFSQNASINLQVEISAAKKMIHFKIIDTGIGIEPKQIENLFNEFVQADNANTREYGGSGLGLAICRHLCRLMGGNIIATSEPGKGSTFIASLPLMTELATGKT
jgi:signal transduction histidine kinase